MDKANYTEDFRYVVDTIRSVHPLVISALPDNFNEYGNKFADNINDKYELIANLSGLTALLQDGHTNIEVEYGNDDLCVNLPCVWLEDGLYASEDYKGILKGDKITGIGNLTISEVLDKLCTIIPHENTYLVKVRATTYPFVNYHIFSEFTLRNINVLTDSSVKVTLSRDGELLTFNLFLEKYNGFLAFKDDDKFIDFRIHDSVGILKLDQCKYNDEYIKRLDDFFKVVKEINIKNIILDLRENMGGDSRVANVFLKYISIDGYYFYGVKARNPKEDELININSEKDYITNKKDEDTDLFEGRIICLVSNKTFSSARIFATVLKDNSIATIVGEPTGGKPCSYGNPLRFKTPNLKISFRVSSRIFTRPAQKGHDDITLFPDVTIYPTRKDIVNKVDVILNKALMLCLGQKAEVF